MQSSLVPSVHAGLVEVLLAATARVALTLEDLARVLLRLRARVRVYSASFVGERDNPIRKGGDILCKVALYPPRTRLVS